MSDNYIKTLKKHIQFTSESLNSLNENIDSSFVDILYALHNCTGHIVVTGYGKSSIIGLKFVATLNSVSIPAIHMHANDAAHGDMGVITSNDVVVVISKSGNDADLIDLVNSIHQKGATSILLSSNPEAKLKNYCDLSGYVHVEKEADEDNIIPTASSICYLAICDGMAMVLKTMKGRSKEDFGQNHPAGFLGKLHFTKVKDLIDKLKPFIGPNDSVHQVITSVSSGRKGATVIIDSNKILGIITDGDLRRMLESKVDLLSIDIQSVMTTEPIMVHEDLLAYNAFEMMQKKKISQIIVHDNDKKYIGILHLHDLVAIGF